MPDITYTVEYDSPFWAVHSRNHAYDLGISEHFPTEREAKWFAKAMNDGHVYYGAMMKVHEKRLWEVINGKT